MTGQFKNRLSQDARGFLGCVNTRLVAAVQSNAGALCHRSANLLHAYYLCADVYRMRLGRGDADAAEAARRQLTQAEAMLRKFLVPASAS